MATFVKSVLIASPVERVFAFHKREDALRLLSPAFPPIRVVSRSGGIEERAEVELRIGGVRWVARHMVYVRNRLFIDQQIEGPFARWVHRHEFQDAGGKTLLTDRVEYALPGGALVNRLLSWAVQLGLRRMFRHRHRVTRKFCELGNR